MIDELKTRGVSFMSKRRWEFLSHLKAQGFSFINELNYSGIPLIDKLLREFFIGKCKCLGSPFHRWTLLPRKSLSHMSFNVEADSFIYELKYSERLFKRRTEVAKESILERAKHFHGISSIDQLKCSWILSHRQSELLRDFFYRDSLS